MASRSFFVVLVALGFSAPLAGCDGTTSCFCGPTQANPLDADSSAIVQDLNMTRSAAHVPTVTVCASLNVSAAAHSDQMRDDNYLAETSPVDSSTVRTRACAAGYKAACSGSIPMAELVAEGNGTGDTTYAQWATDPMASSLLVTPSFVVVGVGHSIGATNEYWTLDFSSETEASCN
jgi:uncharacterized protein YkwD